LEPPAIGKHEKSYNTRHAKPSLTHQHLASDWRRFAKKLPRRVSVGRLSQPYAWLQPRNALHLRWRVKTLHRIVERCATVAVSNWKLSQDVKGNTGTTVSILLPHKMFKSPPEGGLKERLDALDVVVRVIVFAESFYIKVGTADMEGRKATVKGVPGLQINL